MITVPHPTPGDIISPNTPLITGRNLYHVDSNSDLRLLTFEFECENEFIYTLSNLKSSLYYAGHSFEVILNRKNYTGTVSTPKEKVAWLTKFRHTGEILHKLDSESIWVPDHIKLTEDEYITLKLKGF